MLIYKNFTQVKLKTSFVKIFLLFWIHNKFNVYYSNRIRIFWKFWL